MACPPPLLRLLFFISLLGLTGAGQESSFIGAFNLHQRVLELPQSNDLAFAVSVSDDKTVAEISSSVITAETWLRTHVLSRYPSTKITTIVVIVRGFCQTAQQEHGSALVLSSLKNIYHSLVRWGLEKDIKVSSGFSYQCLNTNEVFFEEAIKPLLLFLQTINSTFTITPPPNFPPSPDDQLGLLHFTKKFRSLGFNKVNFINPVPEDAETMMNRRKLRSFVDFSSKTINPFPARPSPLPEISPIRSSIGFSAPATVPTNPRNSDPPFSSQPPSSAAALPPDLPPQAFNSPLSSAPGYSLPPCGPPYPAATPPHFSAAVTPPPAKAVEGLWCVAKPSVAEEILQQALDFACGEGGADCDEIRPHGSCFRPDTAVAHASFAFNSYWQKTKRNGSTCSFGGTAMLITADPSYLHCRFVLS
ncbi:PREDICTED: glucan endo-1,3-beta-glucosidase 13-like [Tarenaya hassleriana]|uniref:glucan endo-1,3-beta-glucosidase 13-like n=1 Tax=Tarenaya hassleriana TaxID=28532 RepID=UPI00053C6FFC|nr:PREDICTED: glucan endo-1,3-beta-glucosidase 13-like [Tarenaya hassleriana]XP_010550334.1 PREDICTED: glucan endo-1,3-beta-glucosidase 13-like [Tarenaya hassleriana]